MRQYNQRSSILSIPRLQTEYQNVNGRIKYNLKISNLPKHYNDNAIISGFKNLIHPLSNDADFKKIILKRTPSGKAFLFVKFAKHCDMKEAFSQMHNKSMGGHMLSVTIADDDEMPKATPSLSAKRASTMYRSGFIVQCLQNGREQMITIIPTDNIHKIKHNNGLKRDRKRIRSTIIKKSRKKEFDIDIVMNGAGIHQKPIQTEQNKIESMDRELIEPIGTELNDIQVTIIPSRSDRNKSDIRSIHTVQQTLPRKADIRATFIESIKLIETASNDVHNHNVYDKTETVSDNNVLSSKQNTDDDDDIKVLDEVPVASNISDISGKDTLENDCKDKEANDIICNSPIAAHFNDSVLDYSNHGLDYSKKKPITNNYKYTTDNIHINYGSRIGGKRKRTDDAVLGRIPKINIANDECKPVVVKKQKTKLKCRLFIENINANIGDHQLKTKFEKFGSVSSSKIIRDPSTNASKGFGFVTFKSSKASKRAIASMHNTSWFGQKLRVSYVSDKTVPNTVTHKSTKRTHTGTNSLKKRSIIPRDPRIARKQQQQPIPIPPKPPKPREIPSPPPPPMAQQTPTQIQTQTQTTNTKAPITHNFSTKQTMETVPKRPPPPQRNAPYPPPNNTSQQQTKTNNSKQCHFSAKAASLTPPNTNISSTNTKSKYNKKLQNQGYLQSTIQSIHSATFYQNGMNNMNPVPFPTYRFMPLVIPGSGVGAPVQQPPIIPGSLTQFNQDNLSQFIAQMQSHVASNMSVNAVAAMNWNHALLLGKLPTYKPNEYHKLRFQIEQSVGEPVSVIHVLENSIASSSNPSDVFTCCAIFDSEGEMQNAYDKLKDCTIANNTIICEMASKYQQQIESALGLKAPTPTPTPTPTTTTDTAKNTEATAEPMNAESNVRLKSMSISRSSSPVQQRAFSPPSASNTPNANSVSSKLSIPEHDSSQRSQQHRLSRERDRNNRRRRRSRSRSRSRSREYKDRRQTHSRERYYHYHRDRFRGRRRGRRKRYNDRDRHRDRDRDRDRLRDRDRDRDRERERRRNVKFSGFEQRKRHRSYSRSRSWSISRTRSRSRSRSYRKDKRDRDRDRGSKTNNTECAKTIKSRCVLLSCSGGHNVRDLKETEITNFVGGSIARIIKRTTPLHPKHNNKSQLYFYIKFENLLSAKHCFEKLKEVNNFHCYSLHGFQIAEKWFDTCFPSPDSGKIK